MKAMNLFWTLAFACAAVSCSDDMNDPGDKGIDEKDGQKAYMTVTISTVSDGTGPLTRAANPNGAGWGEDGNGFLGELPGQNEGIIHDINIYLVNAPADFSKNKQLDNINSATAADIDIVAHGFKNLETPLDGSTGDGEKNHGSTSVTVTMKEDLGDEELNYLVYTIVNAGDLTAKEFKNMGELRDYLESGFVIKSNEDNVKTADNFVMSTHKMYGDNGTNSLVTLSSKNTPESPAQVSVFVERLAARIDLNYPDGAKLTNNNENSPVKDRGTFELTGYMIVNQWNGATKMFKQVTPTVDNYTDNITMRPPYYSANQYLGDEIWDKGSNKFNFVLSEDFFNKTTANKLNSEWDKKYYNHFNEDLNTSTKVKEIPTGGGALSYEDNYDGTKKFYPIAYVRENTMSTSNQLNGYSTGVIFRTKFTPDLNKFTMSKYNPEKGSIDDDAKLTSTESFEFLTAEHFDGTAVHKVIYADVKSVAARAFCIENGTDTKGLLKGFMNGWADDATATLQDARDAIAGMSEKNKLSQLFKEYLNKQMEGVEDFSQLVKDSDKKSTLTYSAFVEDQGKTEQAHADLLNKTPLKSYTSADISNLAEWYGIYFFRDGQSYHKYWIRHDDNENDNVMGVMEFAIVRNNVYQLNVTGVRGLGDPLPYTPGKDDPGTPDESNEISIDVTVYVKDWVRRYNDGIIL